MPAVQVQHTLFPNFSASECMPLMQRLRVCMCGPCGATAPQQSAKCKRRKPKTWHDTAPELRDEKKIRMACKGDGVRATNPDCFGLLPRNERADALPGADRP